MEHACAIQELLQLPQRVRGPANVRATGLLPCPAALCAAGPPALPARTPRAAVTGAARWARPFLHLLLQRVAQAGQRVCERGGSPAGRLRGTAVCRPSKLDTAARSVGRGSQGGMPCGLQLRPERLDGGLRRMPACQPTVWTRQATDSSNYAA